MIEPTPVVADFQRDVCRFGQGETCCSYLGFIPGKGMVCLKGSDVEEVITKRREAKTMAAMGDNCSGPPDFEPTERSHTA